MPAAGDRRRVEVTWQKEGQAARVAVTEISAPARGWDEEKIRWYLEDYPDWPADPAPAMARDAEARLADAGAALFQLVFAGADAGGIWDQARDRLSEVRVEVDTDPSDVPGLPWELLRDPGPATAVALDAGAFVRTHLPDAVQPRLQDAAGDRLRVLLVICRPSGRHDVPFRSVAGRLVRGGAEQMAGLELDVLRPATFARLSEVLHQAAAAGRPYHVVHFDGHGAWLDLADLGLTEGDDRVIVGLTSAVLTGSLRPGRHGYLLFEYPGSVENQQLVDGPALGQLLTAARVPVLVVNACRSAYAEARQRPGNATGGDARSAAAGMPGDGPSAAAGDDVHARIRAYGSLAAEVADAGVPGVIAMRYNVYVVTAAQFMADLYAHLLAGRSLGEAAAEARRALTEDPVRIVGGVPVPLQDWAVPVVYEAAPLVLLRPNHRAVPLVQLTPSDSSSGTAAGGASAGLPRPPDSGFFGHDEALLALDRAFDTQHVVLLHALAGAGKSSTAAEFARWYQATGGLRRPGHRDGAPGTVLWSSFEHYQPVNQLIGGAGDRLALPLEGSGMQWQMITQPAQRRDLILQLLKQMPVLWIWDNVEPVTGFPPGTPSDWSTADQDELLGFLRDLAQQTRCKVLLTSRRDERAWLGTLPARVQLRPMPMRESLQLAAALIERHRQNPARADWRPLLRYGAGNPLTITVLIGQALRENLVATSDIEAFVARLRDGETALEAGEDAALGRTRSLAASLSYGFARAFTGTERAQLAVLHLFRDTVSVSALAVMGDRDQRHAGKDAVPTLAPLTQQSGGDLLDRATEIGLLATLDGGHYRIHPALPWYFSAMFTAAYGQASSPPAERVARAYTTAIAMLADHYHQLFEAGDSDITVLRIQEANLRHALHLARAREQWSEALHCLVGLDILYQRTGRAGEWEVLFADLAPHYIDPRTGGPLPGRGKQWRVVTTYRARAAVIERDWRAARTLQGSVVQYCWSQAPREVHQLQRQGLRAFLGRRTRTKVSPAARLKPAQRDRIRNLARSLEQYGAILLAQQEAPCFTDFEQAFSLYRYIGDRASEANVAILRGRAYQELPLWREFSKAERWYRHSLECRAPYDRFGQAQSLDQLANLAHDQLRELTTRDSFAGDWSYFERLDKLQKDLLAAAINGYKGALNLTPDDDHERRATRESQIGDVYLTARDYPQALHHYQQAIKHAEILGDMYRAGNTRYNIATLLHRHGRDDDALLYARAAMDNFEQAGSDSVKMGLARRLIVQIRQHSR